MTAHDRCAPSSEPAGCLPCEPSPPEQACTDRRSFVGHLSRGAAAWGALPWAALAGAGQAPAGLASARVFCHGVASGDPLADRVVLWTRITLAPGHEALARSVAVQWAVALDEGFTQVVAHGQAQTHAERDFTVKVDAAGLQPGTRYHYRFQALQVDSPVGRTRTLPTGSVQQVRLAVFACANYPAGYFHAYAHAAQRSDLDATVHLGDYLYEYGQGGYASQQAQALGRLVEPAHEMVSLSDYRTRHAQYRSDVDLQALHAAAPMIAVWDDHEVCNDTWREGAQNHQEGMEGRFADRKAAALQAYHEWLPTRNADPERIYRSFAFGELLALHMLDTRLIGRDAPIHRSHFSHFAGFDAQGLQAAVGNPARELLGAPQTQWLQAQLSASTATWQVLGQQVLMARMYLPAPVLTERKTPGHGLTAPHYAGLQRTAEQTPDVLSAHDKEQLQEPWLPLNLDAWDGFQAARETVLGMARTLRKNLVVLAGDSHNAWASELHDAQGQPVGVEFATPGVTSPGLERSWSREKPAALAAALVQLIEPLKYCNTSQRGYLLVTATSRECQAQWVLLDSVKRPQYQARTDATLTVKAGQPGRLLKA